MKLLQVLAVVASIWTTGSAMALEKRDGPVCQTTSGSPLTDDCTKAQSMLHDRQCYDLNPFGSGCRGLSSAKFGTCVVTVCMDDEAGSPRAIGEQIRNGLKQLNPHCAKNGRIGGYYHFSRNNADSACPANQYTGYINVEFTHT